MTDLAASSVSVVYPTPPLPNKRDQGPVDAGLIITYQSDLARLFWRAAERLRAATEWLKANGKKGILGETAGGANAQCIGGALTGMLLYMVSNSDVWTGWLWWGGGPWWGDYMFAMEPSSSTTHDSVLPSLLPYF
ncbi:hypothetical protein VTK26DRAFT_375 [Humicola hyalothermophila]